MEVVVVLGKQKGKNRVAQEVDYPSTAPAALISTWPLPFLLVAEVAGMAQQNVTLYQMLYLEILLIPIRLV